MSAGGPHNPTTFVSAEVYLPPTGAPVSVHPYGYTTARCLKCGMQLNFATTEDARRWLNDHSANCPPGVLS